MDAVIYARFSPRPDSAESESNETQIELCGAFCKSVGYSVIGTEQDADLSGFRADNRPGLQSAIELACRSKAVLVAYSLSRLARNAEDMLGIARTLNAAGANLALLDLRLDTSTPIGKLVLTVLAAVAEFELAQIRGRTSDAMLRHQRVGKRMSGNAPYGFSFDSGGLSQNPSEIIVLEKIYGMSDAGMSANEIRVCLSRNGEVCREKPWRTRSIQGILRRRLPISPVQARQPDRCSA